jgi:hypothetical protein
MLAQFEQNNTGALHNLFINFRHGPHLCCPSTTFWVIIAVDISTVLRGVTPCRVVDGLQSFVHKFCFHLQSLPRRWTRKLSTKRHGVTTKNLCFYCFKVQSNPDVAPASPDIAPPSVAPVKFSAQKHSVVYNS